jgi:hypothetical protein
VQTFERGAQSEPGHRPEQGIGVVTLFEPIIRDVRVYVVYMMKADIAGEPLKDARKVQV